MAYNLTTLYLQNDSLGYLTEVNTLSGGWLAGWLIIALYLAIIFVFQRNSLRKSSIVASLITGLISVYLFTLGLIGLNVVTIMLIILFISIFIVIFGGE